MIRLLDPIRPYLTAAALVAIVAAAAWVWRIDSLRATHKRDLSTVRAEYAAFQRQIVNRTADALRMDRARNAHTTAQQVAIIQEESHDYAHARDGELDRLRQQLRAAPRTDPGGGGATGVPGLPTLSTGTVRPGGAAIVDVADIETGTVNTLRLESVIAAWRRVAAIDPNADADASPDLKEE